MPIRENIHNLFQNTKWSRYLFEGFIFYLIFNDFWYTLSLVLLLNLSTSVYSKTKKIQALKKEIQALEKKIQGQKNKIQDLQACLYHKKSRPINIEKKLQNNIGWGSHDVSTRGTWDKGLEKNPDDENVELDGF